MKTLKWIYNLGKLHERRRIERLLLLERGNQPDSTDDQWKHNEWAGIDRVISKIVDDYSIVVEQRRPIDGYEDLID